MATTSDIKKGMCLEFNNDTYIIVEFQHVKPGKGNAFVPTKIKRYPKNDIKGNPKNSVFINLFLIFFN